MAADGVVTAKASTGSGANNGGGLQITAVKGARPSPRAGRGPAPAAEAQGPQAVAVAEAHAVRVAGEERPERRRAAEPVARAGGRDGGGSKKPRIHFAFFTSAPPADAGLAKDILAHLEGLRDVALDARDAKPPRDDKEYRDRELARIRDAAALVAEVSNASIGGARTMADGDGADEAPPGVAPAAPEPAPEPAPPPPPAPEVDDAPPEFSEVLDAIVMKDRDTRQSRGFGFVTLASQAAANRVLNDKHALDGRILNVSPSQAEKTASATTEQAASAGIKKLYVANLTTRSTEQEMTDAFGAFGPIHECVVMRHSDTGESRGFGFVTYETHEAAAKAVAAQPVQPAYAAPPPPQQQPQGAHGAAPGQQYGAPPPSQQPAPAGYAPGPQGDGAYAPVRGLARSQNPPYAGPQPY
ncbi:hypothetical protein JL720_15998 [Aureococcus anophagefferens]|nr:hypothetical protein JL720_15998 [Aureococcus anophagefferens]